MSVSPQTVNQQDQGLSEVPVTSRTRLAESGTWCLACDFCPASLIATVAQTAGPQGWESSTSSDSYRPWQPPGVGSAETGSTPRCWSQFLKERSSQRLGCWYYYCTCFLVGYGTRMCAEEGFPSLRGGRAVARVYGWRLLGTHAPLQGTGGGGEEGVTQNAYPLSLVHKIAENMSKSEAIIRASFSRQGCALPAHRLEACISVLLQAGIRLLLVMYLLSTLLYVDSYFESHDTRLRNVIFHQWSFPFLTRASVAHPPSALNLLEYLSPWPSFRNLTISCEFLAQLRLILPFKLPLNSSRYSSGGRLWLRCPGAVTTTTRAWRYLFSGKDEKSYKKAWKRYVNVVVVSCLR